MVRMGRTPKGWSQSAATQKSSGKPKHSSPTLQPGRITTNVIASVYGPLLIDKATEIAEEYASALLDWEEIVKSSDNATTSLPPPPKKPRLFSTQQSLDELTDLIRSTSRSISGSGIWRARAHAAKFERLLDEKYGFLRPLLTHPTVEAWAKWAQRKHALGHFSLLRTTDLPLSTPTSVMLLFMLQRNKVRTDALILAALFLLVGLQPWALVCLVCYGVYWKERRRSELPRNAKVGKKKDIKAVPPYYGPTTQDKQEILLQPVGTPIPEDKQKELNELYDTMIVGTGIDTLYCAALLSRMGYRTLVLCPTEDASGCLTVDNEPFWSTVPFDVNDSKVGKIQATQQILAPALCSTTDAQGGVRFATIGTEADGFAYDVISVPGMGGGVTSSEEEGGSDGCIPFVLRAGGIASVAEDSSLYLGDGWDNMGHSSIAQYIHMCVGLNADATEYYYPKMLFKDQQAAWTSIMSGGKWSSTAYGATAIRHAGDFLKRFIPLHPHVRSLAAAIGCRNEDVRPSQTSMAVHVSHVAAAADPMGFAYPVGGPRSLGHALRNTVEVLGGKVVTGVRVQEFVFEEVQQHEQEQSKSQVNDEKKVAPRCVGVKLCNGAELRLKKVAEMGQEYKGAVISFLGVVPTCIKIPSTVRDAYGIPAGVPALKERRPLIHILYGLNGSASDLNLPAADWWRLPSCSLPKDSVDATTGRVTPGNVGGDDQIVNNPDTEEKKGGEENKKTSETEQPPTESTNSFTLDPVSKSAKTKGTTKKFQTGRSWMRISFPSVKDPSWHERHPHMSTCVATIESDDDFCRMINGKPSFAMIGKPSSGETQRLKERVLRDLLASFPQLEGKVAFEELRGPYNAGLSQSAEKFAVKGVRPETQYPGLLLGGKDLTVDSFSGSIAGAWLAANAVMGYTVIDAVLLQKNITTDLEHFLPQPSSSSEVDVDLAVPFTPLVIPSESKGEDQWTATEGEEGCDITAEDSKES